MQAVRRRGSIRWTRAVAITALLACLTPMALVVNGCFTLASLIVVGATRPAPSVIPAGDAIELAPGQDLVLHLKDGSEVHGRYVRRTLLAPGDYAKRFATRTETGAWTPFRLGDPLAVEFADGRRVEGAFAGYAMRALLLSTGDTGDPTRVTFESARSVRPREGAPVSLDSLLAADVRGALPSAEALAMDEGLVRGSIQRQQPRLVPFEDVGTATFRARGKHATGIVALGVGLDLALIAGLAAAASSTWGSCDGGSISYARNVAPEVRWTDRPFDQVHARFFDESVAASDSAAVPPATADEGAAIAPAGPQAAR